MTVQHQVVMDIMLVHIEYNILIEPYLSCVVTKTRYQRKRKYEILERNFDKNYQQCQNEYEYKQCIPLETMCDKKQKQTDEQLSKRYNLQNKRRCKRRRVTALRNKSLQSHLPIAQGRVCIWCICVT